MEEVRPLCAQIATSHIQIMIDCLKGKFV